MLRFSVLAVSCFLALCSGAFGQSLSELKQTAIDAVAAGDGLLVGTYAAINGSGWDGPFNEYAAARSGAKTRLQTTPYNYSEAVAESELNEFVDCYYVTALTYKAGANASRGEASFASGAANSALIAANSAYASWENAIATNASQATIDGYAATATTKYNEAIEATEPIEGHVNSITEWMSGACTYLGHARDHADAY